MAITTRFERENDGSIPSRASIFIYDRIGLVVRSENPIAIP